MQGGRVVASVYTCSSALLGARRTVGEDVGVCAVGDGLGEGCGHQRPEQLRLPHSLLEHP